MKALVDPNQLLLCANDAIARRQPTLEFSGSGRVSSNELRHEPVWDMDRNGAESCHQMLFVVPSNRIGFYCF